MVGLLILLIFMDMQARRHYRTISSSEENASDIKQKSKEKSERKKAAELFASDDEPDIDSGKSVKEIASPVHGTIFVYYIRFRGGKSELVRVKRSGVKTPYTAIRLLQKGPLGQETGLLNPFDSSIKVNSIAIKDNKALIDLSESMTSMSAPVISDRIDQIVFTLTQFPEVKAVSFYIEGKPVRKIGPVAVGAENKPSKRKVITL